MNQLEIYQNVVASDEIQRIQKSLIKNGYALTNDAALGLPGMHQYIDKQFFTDELLGPELSGLPPHDRVRVRDVVEYRRGSGGLVLTEYPIITLRPVANVFTPREYNRTYTLEDSQFVTWLSTVLSMIPPDEEQAHGTLGLDFLRTFRDVVAYKHQDKEQFVVVYVLARETAGAVTSLYSIEDPEQLLDAITIQAGEFLIFRDRDFMHNATPLQPRFDGDKHYRDALILTVHYSTTYLKTDQQ